MLRITPTDERDELYRLPDIVLGAGGVGDLVVNAADDADAPGDLQCLFGLRTQVIICLLTDARADVSELRDGDENRGWIGDSFDLAGAERPIGSKLWLLRRSALADGIEVKAELYARLALQNLIDQGACVRVEAVATVDRSRNMMLLDIALYGRDGTRTFNERFELLWRQDALAYPLTG
jgi:phage gp46-like protein